MAVSRFLIYGLVDPRTGEVRYIGKSSTGMRRPNSKATRAKLAAVNAKPVIELASGAVYKSAADAARILGIDHTSIAKVAAGSTCLKSIHGYRFEYISP